MSLTPAYDEKALRVKKEAVELCGKNKGPHDYIPIEWRKTIDPREEAFGAQYKRVTRLMCRICFCNVSISTLLGNNPEVSY